MDKFGAVHTRGSRTGYNNFINGKNTDISLIISYYSESRLGKAAKFGPPVNLFPVQVCAAASKSQQHDCNENKRTNVFPDDPTQLLWLGAKTYQATVCIDRHDGDEGKPVDDECALLQY